MGNNKPFKLNNRVQMGGATKTTQGAITSNDIDLSSGSYFKTTVGANTTFTFSNPSDVQSFIVDLNYTPAGPAYSLTNGQTLSALSYFQLPTSGIDPYGIFMKPDGYKLYVTDIDYNADGERVWQYNLTTQYDTGSAVFEKKSIRFNTDFTIGATHCRFNNNGTKLFISGRYGFARYSCSTAWDVGSITRDNFTSFSSTIAESPYSMTFNSDGTKLIYNKASSKLMAQRTLSTAFDISTAGTETTFDYSSQTPSDICWHHDMNADGTKLYLHQASTGALFSYSLSTAFDITTASYDSVAVTLNSGDGQNRGFSFSPDGKFMYQMGRFQHRLHQYAIGGAPTITWPTVTWSDGITPSTAIFDRSFFNFVTDDGGTTYNAYHLGSGF